MLSLFPIQCAVSAPFSSFKEKADALRDRAREKANAAKARAQALKDRLKGNPSEPEPDPDFGSWQPVICNGSPAEASFVAVGNTLPLFLNCPNGTGSAGARINVPVGTAAGTFSFDVTPTADSSNAFLYVSGQDSIAPAQFANFGPISFNTAQTSTVTLDLQNLPNGSAEPGATIVILQLAISGNTSGPASVYIDNPKVNGIPVTSKVTTLLNCPPGWF